MSFSEAAIGDLITPISKWKPNKDSERDTFDYVDLSSVDQETKTIQLNGKVAIDDAPSRARQILEPGDVLVSTVRPNLNGVAVVPDDLKDAIGSTGFCVLRPNPKKLCNRYLFHWVKTQNFIVDMTKQATGQSYPAISDKIVKNSLIPIPKDIDEQKRIAAILDLADEMRQSRRHAINRLNDLSQSIFYEMFGDPALNLKSWETKKLSDIGSVDRGVSKHRPRNDPSLLGGNHPLIQTGDVSRAKDFITDYSSTYSDLGLSQSKKWPAGTLCITIAANIADTAILTFDACFPDSVVAFQSESEEINFFIHNWFKFTKGELERIAPAVAQKNINLAILRDLDVIWPGEDQVRDFYIRTKKINEQRNIHQNSLDELERLFLSLQQRAFRGEL